jgi:RNA polymerase sigma factor (sigma-70 family)
MKCGLSRPEAEDVVQEIVVSVAKKMVGFAYDPARGSFKAWLMLVIQSRVNDFLRKKYRRIPAANGDGVAEEERSAPELERLWDEEWRRGLLEAAVTRVKAKVKPRQFQIFDLAVTQGLGIGDVAKALGVSQLNVRVTKHRVAKLLAEEMRRVEADANR